MNLNYGLVHEIEEYDITYAMYFQCNIDVGCHLRNACERYANGMVQENLRKEIFHFTNQLREDAIS